MNIAMLTPGWPATELQNGAATYVDIMRDAYINMGHKVILLAPGGPRVSDGPEVHRLQNGLNYRLKERVRGALSLGQYKPVYRIGETIAANALRIHRREPIHVIEMEEAFGWHADVRRRVPFPVIAKLQGPACLDTDNKGAETQDQRRKIQAEGRALRDARFILSPTEYAFRAAWRYYDFSHGNARIIFNPVRDVDPGMTWSITRCERKSILFVGRFDRHKGGAFVLRMFRHLLNYDPSYKLTFIGPAQGLLEEEGKLWSREKYVEYLFSDQERSAISLLGPKTPTEIEKFRIRASAVVVCSQWDNQPYTLLTAMVQGCPVVATSVGGIPEVVRDGQTGLLADRYDEAGFARRVLDLGETPVYAAELGAAARVAILRDYSAHKLAAETINYYEECIRAKKAER